MLQLTPYRPTAPLAQGTALLEASAGTGKTFSIADLYVRLVAEADLEASAILVVTFTKAATAELRDRIRRRLGEALAAIERAGLEPGYVPQGEVLAHLVALGRREDRLVTLGRRLLHAREAFDTAGIFTIHGFCQRMLQRNAFESGIDFELELLHDARKLLSEAVDDFLVRELHDARPSVVRFLQALGVTRDGLTRLGRIVCEHPGLHIEPAPQPGDRSLAELLQRWAEAVAPVALRWQAQSASLLEVLAAAIGRTLKANMFKADKTHAAAEALAAWFAAGGPPDLAGLEHLRWFSTANLARCLAKAASLPAHDLLDDCQHLLDTWQRLGLPAAVDRLRAGFCRWLGPELEQRKAARRQQTYADLLARLAGALQGEAGVGLRVAIRQLYRAALIDEFQDTDPLQWRIFHAVFGEDADLRPPLYLIGDPKQAIYGFRGADLHTYLEARASAEAGRHTLDRNFRSDGQMVAAVQHLFGGALPFADARIGLPDIAAALEPCRVSPAGPGLQLRFLTEARVRHTLGTSADPAGAPSPSANAAAVNKDDARAAIARHVAQDAVRLLASGTTVRDAGTVRPLRPGDIAVLVRTNHDARVIQRALARAGLPAVVSSDADVLQSPTAADLGILLGAIATPGDPGALAAALATALFGLDAAGIARLDADDALRDLWSERARVWHTLWNDKGFVQMTRALLSAAVAVDPIAPGVEVSIPERLLALPDGERRLTDLLHLTELAQAAALREGLQPAGLLAWYAGQRASGAAGDEGRELRLETDAAAVQIVTVHKSKGLQYPFVLCPGLWDGKIGFDKDNLLFHDPARPGSRTLDLSLDTQAEPKASRLALARLEAQAENLRVAYVALTRAQHRTVVYLGRFSSYGSSALGWLVHRRDADPQNVLDPALLLADIEARVAALAEPELLEAVRAAAAACPALALTEVEPYDAGLVHEAGAQPAPVLQARLYTGHRPDTWWRRASYSALLGNGHPDASREERRASENDDALDAPLTDTGEDVATGTAEPLEDAPVPAQADAVPLAQLAAGKDAGTFLHAVLEHHDFTASPGAPALVTVVRNQARLHGLSLDPAPIAAGLDLVLDTPLGPQHGEPWLDGVRLRDIGKHQRLNELDFDFPLVGATGGPGQVTSRQLAAVLHAHRAPGSPMTDAWLDRVARLGFVPLRGFMNGSIDLVFKLQRAGQPRFYLADYKSNHLGERQGGVKTCTRFHYQPGRLRAEMEHGDYFLQYHLYAVALHRWLTWRMRNYSYDAHFGGCLYLFVRGMVGPQVPATGVFFDRPPLRLIEALSALLATGGEP